MPGRHVRRAAASGRARGKAPATASRISAVTTIGVFIMVVLIGVIVEHSMAPHLGVGYRVPASASHGRKPRPAVSPGTAPRVHRGGHAPAVKHPVASVASVPGAVRLTMTADRGAAAAAAFGGMQGTGPSVDLLRHDGSFVFGTAAIGVPSGVAAMPQTALFLARAGGGTWHVAVDGTSGFGQMLRQAPEQMIPAAEKQLLSRYNAARRVATATRGGTGRQAHGQGPPAPAGGAPSASHQAGGAPSPSHQAGPKTRAPGSAGRAPSSAASSVASAGGSPSARGPADRVASSVAPAGGAASAAASTARTGIQTGLALPWKTGGSWTMIPTPGQRPAAADPLAQASFTGGNGRVLSAGSGRLYRFCGSGGRPGSGDALIEVIHSDGSATEYYQIDRETAVRDGSPVPQGAYLGQTGTSLACGGSAGRPEAEFSLLRRGGRGLDGTVIGGWTFHEELQPLRVWVQRGGKQAGPGSPLRNLGAPA
jgi:hypothetical protein